MTEPEGNGLIQIYTGDGKGKTTAALGLAIRAAGHGKRVCFVQFLKGRLSGEHFFVSQHHLFELVQLATISSFTGSQEQLRRESQQTLTYVEELMLSSCYNLIILDEVFAAMQKDFISTQQLLRLLDKKPQTVEMVLTGRNAPPELIQRADLVTEMRMTKHPFNLGIAARPGIEY